MSIEATCHACGEEFDARMGVCPVCGDKGGHVCPHSEVTPTISAVTSVMAIQITIFGFKCVECGKQWDIGDACEALVRVTRLEKILESFDGKSTDVLIRLIADDLMGNNTHPDEKRARADWLIRFAIALECVG